MDPSMDRTATSQEGFPHQGWSEVFACFGFLHAELSLFDVMLANTERRSEVKVEAGY
jgi:hypothetical protein